VKRSLALPAAYVRGHPASALDASRFAGWMGLPCARLSHSYWRRPGMREIEITDQFAALWPLS